MKRWLAMISLFFGSSTTTSPSSLVCYVLLLYSRVIYMNSQLLHVCIYLINNISKNTNISHSNYICNFCLTIFSLSRFRHFIYLSVLQSIRCLGLILGFCSQLIIFLCHRVSFMCMSNKRRWKTWVTKKKEPTSEWTT